MISAYCGQGIAHIVCKFLQILQIFTSPVQNTRLVLALEARVLFNLSVCFLRSLQIISLFFLKNCRCSVNLLKKYFQLNRKNFQLIYPTSFFPAARFAIRRLKQLCHPNDGKYQARNQIFGNPCNQLQLSELQLIHVPEIHFQRLL